MEPAPTVEGFVLEASPPRMREPVPQNRHAPERPRPKQSRGRTASDRAPGGEGVSRAGARSSQARNRIPHDVMPTPTPLSPAHARLVVHIPASLS